MDLPIENIRFREIREELGYTQVAFAQLLDIGSSTTDIERGKVKLSGTIVKELYGKFGINPLWLFGESPHKKLNQTTYSTLPKVITINDEGNENILMVNEKAAAGYGKNLGDIEFIEKLPSFNIPLPTYRNASFRCFEVQGDSMHPIIQDKSWVLSEAVANIKEIKNGEIYIIVEVDSIRIKLVEVDANQEVLQLISINPEYPTTTVAFTDIQEIWKYHSQLQFHKNESQLTLKDIYKELTWIKDRLNHIE